jgi:hypothetical protein
VKTATDLRFVLLGGLEVPSIALQHHLTGVLRCRHVGAKATRPAPPFERHLRVENRSYRTIEIDPEAGRLLGAAPEGLPCQARRPAGRNRPGTAPRLAPCCPRFGSTTLNRATDRYPIALSADNRWVDPVVREESACVGALGAFTPSTPSVLDKSIPGYGGRTRH